MMLNGPAKMIRIHFGEDDRRDGKPLYEVIVEEALRRDMAGATAYRGFAGYGASSRIHRQHRFASSDLPIMVAIVDTVEKIESFLPVIRGLVDEGLIVMSDVEVIRCVHRDAPPAA